MEKTLREFFLKEDSVDAFWLGGSKATNKEDQLSDLDLMLVTSTNSDLFKKFETFLNETFGITHKWELGEIPGKGYHQAFYVLSGFHELFYLDVVVFHSPEAQLLGEYFNQKRHGAPYILFDKTGILENAKKLNRSFSPKPRAFEDELGQLEVMYRTFMKEVKRGHYLDSFTFYHRMVFQLVTYLRRIQAPERFDFGTRYLYSDLKKEDALFIEDLLKVTSLDDMIAKAEKLRMKFTA